MTLIALLYGLTGSFLALYGLHALFLTALFFRHRAGSVTPTPPCEAALPPVTVQLPIFNEKYVATRLLDAVCRQAYPRDRLQVQVLDDSTDETVEIVARRVRFWQRRGVEIKTLRRPERRDYKAGALAHGLPSATGELIAIFDADFEPAPDWLRQAVGPFCQPGSERLGLVQTRWSHLNADFSPLTRAQALMLDGHFAVEQAARAGGGLLFNFNGTAGVWRRQCIEEAGGWSARTLCEDLDLSYRAQLRGWHLAYTSTLAAPAELPAQMTAFKRQQFRWAKGSLQVARHMLGTVVRGPLSWQQKVAAALHLGGYTVQAMMVLLLLLTLPLLVWGWPAGFASFPHLTGVLGLAGLGGPVLYAVSQGALHGREGWRRFRWMPVLVLLGSGLALSNARAVLEGLFGAEGGEFRRTPKFRLEGREGAWQGSTYALAADATTWGELVLAGYALLCCGAAVAHAQWFALPFLLLYVLGFGWVGGQSLWESYQTGRPKRWRARRARAL